MKPIFAIGLPSSFGLQGYKGVKDIVEGNKNLKEHYIPFVYLQKITNEWTFQVLNGEGEDLSSLTEIMQKLEALES